MKHIQKNKFRVRSNEVIQVRIHKDLVKLLDEIVRIEQRKADLIFGKNKVKISRSYASKILAGGITK
jgi:hypothetical protein